MLKRQRKGNVFYRLFFNRGDERAYVRFAFFFDTLMINFSNVFSQGAFYTAFLRLNNISMSDVGVMTYLPIVANLSCIFTPFVFRNMKRRKAVLMSARMAYFLLNLVGVALVPFLFTDAAMRVFLMSFFLSAANVVWGLFVGGFSDWELNALPLDGTREDFFAYRSLICSLVAAATQLFAGVVASAIETTAPETQLVWLFWLRVGGFLFILLDVAVFVRAKEFDYAKSEVTLKFKNILTVPLRQKTFRNAILLRAFMTLTLAVSSSSWSYYLLDCGLKYSTLTYLGMIPPILALFLTKPMLRVFKRLGCVNHLFLFRCLELFVYIGYFFVMPSTATWLYPICLVALQIISVGGSIGDLNFVYLFMPTEDRLTYYTFYYSVSSLMSFLGSFIGAQYITRTDGKSFFVLGLSVSNVQLLMLFQTVGFFVFLVAFALLRKGFDEKEKALKM